MAHKVFICHSSKDKAVADAACAALEAHRIPCWIAPRDIPPSAEWGASIVDAITECQIVLLIFSAHANESPDVRREINLSISEQKDLLPFRIENVTPTGAIKYAVSNRHWLDAVDPPMERRLLELTEKVGRLLNLPPETGPLWQPPQTKEEQEQEAAAEHLAMAHADQLAQQEAAQQTATQAALDAEKTQRAAKKYEEAQIAEQRKREEEERIAAAQHEQEEASRKSQAEEDLQTSLQTRADAANAKTDTPTIIPDAHWWQRLTNRKAIPAICLGLPAMYFAFARWGLPVVIYEGVLRGDPHVVHTAIWMDRYSGVSGESGRDPNLIYYEWGCVAKVAHDCSGLADRYENGDNVSQDSGKALALKAKALTLANQLLSEDKDNCDQSRGDACFRLGRAYRNGYDGRANGFTDAGGAYHFFGDLPGIITLDPAKAALFDSQSCDLDYVEACIDLGDAYRDGNGVNKSLAKAKQFYRKSCQLNSDVCDLVKGRELP